MDGRRISRKIKAVDFFDKLNGEGTLSDQDFKLAYEYYKEKMGIKKSLSAMKAESLLKRIDDIIYAAHHIADEDDDYGKFLKQNGFVFGIEDITEQFDKMLNKYYNKYKKINKDAEEDAKNVDVVFEDMLASLSAGLQMPLSEDISLSSFISYSLIAKKQNNG